MIISLVSRYNKAGKSLALDCIIGVYSGVVPFSFAESVNDAASCFIESDDKYAVCEDLGVSLKDVNHAITKAVEALHPELPVFLTKERIINLLDCANFMYEDRRVHIITADTRRERDFKWLDGVAKEYGTKHCIVEIIPIGKQLEVAQLDTWSNGLESCGYEAWSERDRSIIFNDGTSEFDQIVVATVQALMDGKNKVIGPF